MMAGYLIIHEWVVGRGANDAVTHFRDGVGYHPLISIQGARSLLLYGMIVHAI